MAVDVRNLAVIIAAGTLKAAPQLTDIPLPARVPRSVRWRVPMGPFGQVGFALASGGQRVIPSGPGEWIVANDEWDELPLTDQIESGAWQLMGYNLGRYPHTIYLTFTLDPLPVAGSGLLLPLSISPR